MDTGFFRGLIAVITLLTFLGICWWAYRPGNKSRFEADAMLPFDDDDERTNANDDKEEALR
jgi:cytochrome c oxidase cbb3-type subunit 4